MSNNLTDHLAYNKKWAKSKVRADSGYFEKHAQGQSPKYLWIGCSDSRVPPNEILGMDVGEVFVHRNVANLAQVNDVSVQSVLYFAIKVLKVEHILVCGHYNCGGIQAVMQGQEEGPLVEWLSQIKHLSQMHEIELQQIKGEVDRVNRLCEINISAQVGRLREHPLVLAANNSGAHVTVHGLVYDIQTGRLKRLI